MHPDLRRRIGAAIAAAVLLWACQAEHLVDTGATVDPLAGLDPIAIRLEVNLTDNTVRQLPLTGASTGGVPRDGLAFAILGTSEVGVTTSNLVRSAPVGGKVTVTFDAAITNRLTSSSLVAPTFPNVIAGGLLLFPYRVTNVTGGVASQVIASADWDGDGTAGSGAPRNFFNDFGCTTSGATSDCFRWEQYPAPLGPGENTAGQRVGFTVPKAVTAFQVLLVLAANVSNDLPAVAAIGVTPSSYTMNDGFPKSFTAVAYDAANNPLPWATLTWTTADITALEFQYGGALVGVMTGPSQVVHGRKVGLTSFTVSSGGVSVIVPVDIQVNTVALVQLYTPDSSLTVGDQIQGDARVKDHQGGIIPGFLPTWSTTDPNVITVDQNGLITAVGAGTADVVATAGQASAFVTITVGRLIAGDIAGVMRDLDGQPVAGANVRATGVPGAVTTTTASDGTYLFHNLPITGQGLYIVDWSPPGCVAGAQNRIVLLVGGVVTVNIDVDCPPSVSGVLKMVQGSMPAGLTVELQPDAGGPNRVGVVQPDGSYSIAGLASGGYFILLNGVPANCAAPAGQKISLTQQTHYVHDWSLDCLPTSGLLGLVRDVDGQAVAGATVDARSQSTGQLFSTTTDGAGHYLLYLAPDRYDLTTTKAGPCGTTTPFTWTVPPGQPILSFDTMDCRWRIQGGVTALGTLPLPLTVFVSSASGPAEQAAVQADGSYDLTELPAPNGNSGALTLALFGLPTRCAVTGTPPTTTIRQQMQLQVPDFTLDCRPPSIQVLVTDGGTNGNPQPLIGMQVNLVGPSGAANSQTGFTGQNGVLFPTAEAGGNLITVAQGTYGCLGNSTLVTIQPGTQPVVVVPVSCSTTGALEGTVRTMLGNPLANTQVIVGSYNLLTDANGHWGVAGLPGGLLFVIVSPVPVGCALPAPFQAAVIPAFTIQANATVSCTGF